MELRVGSNIMIHFLDILLLLVWQNVLVYYTLLVVIIICIMFVKLRKCWSRNVVKRSEFGYTRE